MSFIKRIYLFILFSAIGIMTLSANDNGSIKFSHISLNNGLSQSTVFSIAQDKRGNMWFATYDGVNKFDGYDFTIYQHDASDPHSIANDIARTVMTDSQGRIWIGTRDGLSWYNEEKDLFRNFFYKKNGKNTQVNGIAEINPEQLLISSQEGLLLFNVKDTCFIDNKLSTEMHQLKASTISRQGENIYVGTNNGLFEYSIGTGRLSTVTNALDNKQIQAVLLQSPTRLWVATEGTGLYLLNPKTGEVKNYRHSPGTPQCISSNFIRSLALDSQNRLWIGTFNDLNIYHEGHDSFVSFSSNPVEDGSLSQSSVRSIFMDSQGGMWLGTYFGGLNYYHPLKNRFRNITRIPYQNSLNDNVVSCIIEDNERNLWIGTNDGGLNLYNPKTKRFSYYTLQEGNKEGIGSNNVKAVYVDEKQGRVYIGTHAGGLSVLQRNTGRIEHFNMQNSELLDDNVYAILPDGEQNLWLGTLQALIRFNPEKRSFTVIDKEKNGNEIPNRRITTLFRDSRQRIWVGGEEGLCIYKVENGEVESLHLIEPTSSLAGAFINCVYETQNDVFWIGTREGVYSYNEKKNTINAPLSPRLLKSLTIV